MIVSDVQLIDDEAPLTPPATPPEEAEPLAVESTPEETPPAPAEEPPAPAPAEEPPPAPPVGGPQFDALMKAHREAQDKLAELQARLDKSEAGQSEAEEKRIKGDLEALRNLRRKAIASGDSERAADLEAAIEERKDQLDERRFQRLVRSAQPAEKPVQQSDQSKQMEHVLRIQTWRETHSVSDTEFSKAAQHDDKLRQDPRWASVSDVRRWNEALRLTRQAQARPPAPKTSPVSSGTQEPKPTAAAKPQLTPDMQRLARHLRISEAELAGLMKGDKR